MLLLIAEAALQYLPAPLHRVLLRGAHALRKLWWRWRQPRLAGCRVIALDDRGRVLLVRHSYGAPDWMPPGGGMKAGEDAIAAATRELAEETGCRLTGPTVIEVAHGSLHGAGNIAYVVAGRCHGVPRPDMREIVATAFFAADALPDTALAPRLARWMAQAAAL